MLYALRRFGSWRATFQGGSPCGPSTSRFASPPVPTDQDGAAGRTGSRSLSPLRDLAASWREDADRFREYGADELATAAELHADALEERLRAWRLEALSPVQAAEESGYTADHLRRLIRQERVPNAGDDASPKIRRQDLPRKPGHGDPPRRPVASRSRVASTVLDSDQEAEDGKR